MINRRQFLYLAGAGAANVLKFSGLPFAKSALAASETSDFSPDVELSLRAKPAEVQILPGRPTTVWQYSGQVIKGDPGNLAHLDQSSLGPVIRVRRHQKVRIHFKNDLPARSIIHWHGLHVPAEMDGHPKDVISTGATFTYEFEVLNRAGTYWYHPHPHGRTGHQVYGGLAGLFLVTDAEEQKLNLPDEGLDIPLVIQDRVFNRDNQLVYLPRGMHDSMTGMLGDSICVNGRPDFTLSVSNRAYRLRILNGSNSRIYKLAWSDGTPLTVIATDGGLLEKPIDKKYVVLGPAERIELWADFSRYPVGTSLELVSKYFEPAMQGSALGPRRGMTVREPDGKGLAETLVAQLQMSKVSLPQLLQVRSVLEAAIVELAAAQRTAEDLDRLHDNLESMKASDLDRHEAIKVDLEFHDLLAAATHNPFFTLVSRPITELLYSIYINKSGYMSFQSLTTAEHEAVVDAIVDKDPAGAVLAIQKHLDRVGATVAELLSENQGEY